MHILILSKRNAEAQNRLVRAAEALAVRLELDPGFLSGLKLAEKDKDVRELKQREGVAALLEELAYMAGALERPTQESLTEQEGADQTEAVTVVTDAGEEAGDNDHPEKTYPAAVPGDELPPPVLEGDGVQEGRPDDSGGVAPHTGDEFVTVPAEPAADEETLIEEPVEKEPEEKLAPKSTSKKKSTSKSSKKK